MRTKVTLILLFLNVALFAYIYYYRSEFDRQSATKNLVLGPETSNIHTLEIAMAGSDTPIKIEHTADSSWSLIQPLQWPANEFAVSRIINELQQLHPDSSFSVNEIAKSGQTLADYSLDKPPLVLTFTAVSPNPSTSAPKSFVLKIGKPTSVGNRIYVLSPDGQTIHVVNRSLAESLALRIEDLRSDTLFTIPTYEVRSFKLQPPPPAAGTRISNDNNNRWLYESPFKTNNVRANKNAMGLTINTLHTLRAKTFIDPQKIDSTRTGLSTPELQITLNGNNRHETLILGAPVEVTEAKPAQPTTGESSGKAEPPSAEYYAQMDDKSPIFKVAITNQLLDTLRNAQETLRDTHVLDIEPSNATSITLVAPNQAQITLQRLESTSPNPSTASWQVVRHNGEKGPQTFPADRDLIDRLLQKLAQLTAERFVDDAPSASALEDFGFSRPSREITISLAKTQVSNAITLQIGTGSGSGTEQIIYAKLQNQPYVYRVANTILQDTPVSALAYRDRVVRELPAGAQITGLKLTDLSNNNVLFDTAIPIPETAGKDTARRTVIETLAVQLRTLKAKSFLREEFTDTINVNGEERKWRYRLDTTVSLVGGAGTQTTSSAIYFSERAGGTIQYVGSPDLGLVFEADQALLDAIFAAVYGPNDPGPTPPPAETAPAAIVPPAAAADTPPTSKAP